MRERQHKFSVGKGVEFYPGAGKVSHAPTEASLAIFYSALASRKCMTLVAIRHCLS